MVTGTLAEEGVEQGAGARRDEERRVLDRAAELAQDYLDTVDGRPVAPRATVEQLRKALGGELPDDGRDPLAVVEELARDVEPGLTAMNSPRYFGFVIGGSLPAALGADWLTSAWEQNAGMVAGTPAAAVVEETAARWLLDLLGLPTHASVGFTTGATMANFTAIAAARHALLRGVGWDVEEQGLIGAPQLHVVVGDEVHVSAVNALRMAGLGRSRAHRVPVDDQGRMRADSLRTILAGCDGPTVVLAQAGNVNSGAFDPLDEVATAVADHGRAWMHVDGAFGLWAAASPRLRQLMAGAERADSWATDAHKTLNVPYDAGLVFVRDAAAHRASMSVAAAYLPPTDEEREPFDYVPEMSRRARGFPIYAALRSLGRRGLVELVERLAEMAQRAASRLATEPGVEILNDVVFNQVLVRFGDDDERTREVIARVQADGTAWVGGTVWQGRGAMRISVSGWATTADDIDRSVEAILAAYRSIG